MASPDVAAATYIPHWRSRPIPNIGDRIKLVGLVSTEGSYFLSTHHAYGVVDEAHLDDGDAFGDTLLIRLADDAMHYILRDVVPACDWALERSAPREEPGVEPEAPAAETMPPPSIVALERRLLAIQTRLKALEGEQDALKTEAALLNQEIRTTALEQEMESLPAVDGMTAYFCPVYHVERKIDETTGKPFTTADVVAALRASGHQHLISETANGNQVRALLREIVVDHEQPIPPALAPILELKSRYDVRFTPMQDRKRRAAPRSS